ncbi:MAG TPA: hypothetical protein VFJ19_05550 [Nocardioidaceae bacterium]|nr:hypothetical protein [Nocardioidaceae bacterium]
MSAPTPAAVRAIPPAPRNAAAVRAARRQWHRATEAHGPSDEWDRRVIDRVIRHLAGLGEPFSCNDARELLPEVRKCLIGRAFERAQREGWLVKVGYTPSTLPSTKGHPVAVYAPTDTT